MSRRNQHHHTVSGECEEQRPTRPQRPLRTTALVGSGLSGAALSWGLGHNPMWAAAAVGIVAVAGAIARHTPDLVRVAIWRLALRAVLQEVRQFAREDLLSTKITPQDLMKLAATVQRHTVENHHAQPQDDRDN